MADETTFNLRLERFLLTPETPAVPVFHFSLTRVGNQVLLEPGYVDLVELRAAIEQAHAEIGQTVAIKFYVKEKYLLGRETLTQLRVAVDQILESMPDDPERGNP